MAVAGFLVVGGAALAVGYLSRKQLSEYLRYLGFHQNPLLILTNVKEPSFDIGIVVEQNHKHMDKMENTHAAFVPYLDSGLSKAGYFAIFDGHGSSEVAELASRYLHELLAKELKTHKERKITSQQCFENAYARMDEGVLMCKKEVGATAVTCVLQIEADDRIRLMAANVGDCRAVVCRAGQALRVTCDHRPDDADEKARIEAAGGFVAMGRVNSYLAVSRAIGDHVFKRWVPCVPHVWDGELGPEDSCLVMACDGLWDVVSEEAVVAIAQRHSSGQAVSEALLREALKKGSQDNITIMAIRFHWKPRPLAAV